MLLCSDELYVEPASEIELIIAAVLLCLLMMAAVSDPELVSVG